MVLQYGFGGERMRSIGTAVLLLLALPASVGWAQCALCRSAVESGDPTFAQVLRSGIVLLLVFPYLLGLIVGIVLWRARRQRMRAFQWHGMQNSA
jgi:hypothetical protein